MGLAIAAGYISDRLVESQRIGVETHRINVQATAEAYRIRDAADARQEMKDAHAEGVSQGVVAVIAGVSVGFALVIGAFAITSRLNRPRAWDS
jgi:hypothetical protein